MQTQRKAKFESFLALAARTKHGPSGIRQCFSIQAIVFQPGGSWETGPSGCLDLAAVDLTAGLRFIAGDLLEATPGTLHFMNCFGRHPTRRYGLRSQSELRHQP